MLAVMNFAGNKYHSGLPAYYMSRRTGTTVKVNGGKHDKSLSAELLADEFSVSPSYLSRYFKEQTNLNFTDYVHSVRLSKAKELLTVTDFTVADIADKVGYNSIYNFTRVFKRYEDITPTDYRLSEVNKGNC